MLYNKEKRGDIMAQISLRVDDEVKRSAEKILDDIGLSMSTAINIFLKTVVRENRIPFELSADPFYSRENIMELERRVEGIHAGKSIFKNLSDNLCNIYTTLFSNTFWEIGWSAQEY